MSAGTSMNDRVADAPTQNTYHHGNLRQALLDAAVTAIRDNGPENLSLRALARSVGVSQTAPYRHFTDKNDLLVELAQQTFTEITRATERAINPADSCQQRMLSAGDAFLRYAAANPEKYKLVFGNSIEHPENYPHLVETGQRCFAVMLTLIDDGIRAGEFIQADAMLLANVCWSGIHGFSSLWIDGLFARRELPADFDTMLSSQIRATVRAISATPDAIKI